MSTALNGVIGLSRHHEPENLSDRVAHLFGKVLRLFADRFFVKRYGNRAIVLETMAAGSGMANAAMRAGRRVLRRPHAPPELTPS